MDLELINGKRVLCLGLGLGSVIQLISERSKNVQFTAVELDDEVIRLAEKYILHKVDADIEVIAADALIFMQMTQWEYDMICMDIFIDDEIPEVFMSKDFCSLLKGAVENSGIIIFNTPAFDKKVAKESTLFFNKMFKDVFPKARILKIHKNHMLLSSDHLLRE